MLTAPSAGLIRFIRFWSHTARMGNLRSYVLDLCLALAAPAMPLCAQTLDASDPVRLFATCTGRLSALMEYQWLVQDPRSALTEVLRDQMSDLSQAALPVGGEVRAMDLRLQAKAAEATVLQQALFGRRDRADWAAAQAQHQLDSCTALLLS